MRSNEKPAGAEPAIPGERVLNRVAAACALAPLAALAFDLAVSLIYGAAPTSARDARSWLEVFGRSPILGLQGLSFPQLITTLLGIPLTVALYQALRSRSPGPALLALAFGLTGGALFLAQSASLPMLSLGERWAAASSDAERGALAAAAEAVLARNADFTPAGCLPFILPCASSLILTGLMRGAPAFGKGLSILGLAGFGLLLAFTLGASFVPGGFAALLSASVVGGLASMAWNVLVAIRLWRA
jgi:hypothetical protein